MPEPWQNAAYANDSYLQSLATSSSDVTRQVQNALTEISRQRGVNQGQASQIPGATQGIFEGAQAATQESARSLGVSPLASIAAALTGNQESYGRVSGLLQQGFGERATRQTGNANNIGQELQNDLRVKGTEYVSKREQETREQAFQAQQAAAQRALQEEMMRRQMAMQQAAMAQSAAQAQQQAAIDLWMANLDNPWPEEQQPDGAMQAYANYLGMKDRQNLQ